MLLKYWWVEFLCVDRSIKELQSHWQTQKSIPICFQIGNQPWLLKPIWKSKGDNDLKYLYVYVNHKLDCRQCLSGVLPYSDCLAWFGLFSSICYPLPTVTCELWIFRSNYIPASNYLSYLNGEEELTEEIKGLDINGDEPVENGHGLHEVHYYPIWLEIWLYFICCFLTPIDT